VGHRVVYHGWNSSSVVAENFTGMTSFEFSKEGFVDMH
jgi:hypothetical protein